MSDWKRTTKEVLFENLRPDMVEAIRKHIERHNLGMILSEPLMCVQVDSETVNKGLFRSAETVSMGVVVTLRWLVWALSGTKTPTTVLSAQLRDIVVRDYAQTQFAKMIPDTGIEVSGRFTDASENVSAFIGLDDSPAGTRFREIVIQAVQDAKR